jgi:hypothetical protein
MMPTDFMDVTLSSWLTSTTQTVQGGSGKVSFTFFGYRVRVDQQGKIVNSVFG